MTTEPGGAADAAITRVLVEDREAVAQAPERAHRAPYAWKPGEDLPLSDWRPV